MERRPILPPAASPSPQGARVAYYRIVGECCGSLCRHCRTDSVFVKQRPYPPLWDPSSRRPDEVILVFSQVKSALGSLAPRIVPYVKDMRTLQTLWLRGDSLDIDTLLNVLPCPRSVSERPTSSGHIYSGCGDCTIVQMWFSTGIYTNIQVREIP